MALAAEFPRLPKGLSRRLVLAAAAAALVTMLSAAGPRAIHVAEGAGVPAPTTSLYVYGSYIDACGLRATTACPLFVDGAKEAVPAAGGMTILDLGAPCFEPETREWGGQLFNSKSCTPDSTLVILARAWLRGYETKPGVAALPTYVLALGTSNSLTAAVPGNALSPEQMASSGKAWFASVVKPVADIAETLQGPVTIWAGNDIEQSSDGNWYDGPTTTAWVDAYAAASRATKPCMTTRSGLMVDYGDYVPNASGWSPAAVYHVAWQAAPACPLPEIYNSVNATEWQSLNQYAASAGVPPMQFLGVLSEDGADGSLSGPASWSTLSSATGQAAPYISLIGLTVSVAAVAPDAPKNVTAAPGPGLVMLTWSAPAWDGGAAITAYTVNVHAGSTDVETLTFIGFPAPETVLIAGLADGTTYTFDVTATNSVGAGPQSLRSWGVAPQGLLILR